MEQKHVFDNAQFRAAIVNKLGITQQALTNWKQRGIPAERCPDIEALTGIKCEELRPDVNWSVLRRLPRKTKAAAPITAPASHQSSTGIQ